MPAIILFTWIARWNLRTRSWIAALLWLCTAALGARQVVSKHLGLYTVLGTPGGTIAVSPLNQEKLQWFMQHSTGNGTLFQAAGPSIYLPLQMRNAIFLEGIGPSRQTRPEHVELGIRQLDSREVAYILWSPSLESPRSADASLQSTIEPLHAYLQQRYVRVKVFSDQDEVWQRK